MNIAFIASAYHKAEAFASVCKSFERMGHKVFYYPVYMRSWEHGQQSNPEIKDDAQIKRAGLPAVYDDVFLLATRCDLMIFWKAEAIHPNIIKKCSEITRTVYYSWDDPYQLEVDTYAMARAASCHVAFSCCEKTARVYETQGAKKGLWLPPAYDPEVHFEDGKPEVDVCFIATNTYCKEIYGDKCFDRRDLVNAVREVTDSIELWGQGDQPLGWFHSVHGDKSFEKYYKEFIPFEKSRTAYSRAKICLNSHVRRNGNKYFNERTFQIMGCNRPMVIDDNPGIRDVLGDTAMYYNDLTSLKDVVDKLLKDENLRNEKAKAGYEFSKDYTWDTFCQKILEEGS